MPCQDFAIVNTVLRWPVVQIFMVGSIEPSGNDDVEGGGWGEEDVKVSRDPSRKEGLFSFPLVTSHFSDLEKTLTVG